MSLIKKINGLLLPQQIIIPEEKQLFTGIYNGLVVDRNIDGSAVFHDVQQDRTGQAFSLVADNTCTFLNYDTFHALYALRDEKKLFLEWCGKSLLCRPDLRKIISYNTAFNRIGEAEKSDVFYINFPLIALE